MAPKKENEGRKGQRKPPTNRIDPNRTPMSERQKLFSESSDEGLCSVCWNEVGPGLRSFAVGLCDHPICSVCSVRSRYHSHITKTEFFVKTKEFIFQHYILTKFSC